MREPLLKKSNKYSRGVVAVAAGSARFPGAALLTVGGARRGNAGYVKFLSQDARMQDLVIARFPDVVPIENLDGERVDALVVGPGMGSVKKIPERIPLVLDGESISLSKEQGFISDHPITVITPHEGELRHCGINLNTPLDDDDRRQIAQKVAREIGVIIVLKGHRTVIAEPEGEYFVDEIGGPELATAGSGDLLAGLIGSFLVAASDVSRAMDMVSRAVTLHSKAGRHAAEKYSSVTALEILESLAYI